MGIVFTAEFWTWSRVLEVMGLIIGLLYLWWEYHADWRMWIASMVMPAISMWIYFSRGIYADFAINIYYLVIAVYGFIVWRCGAVSGKKKKERRPLPVTHTPLWAWGVAVASTALLWGLLYWLLGTCTDSTVPCIDAFTTAASIVAMWLMARKWAQQWLVWFVVDIISSGLYFYKGIPFYGVLYCIYTVIAVFGYIKWIKMIPETNH